MDLEPDFNVYSLDVRISEVAKLSGVPASTLRYYERIKLIASNRKHNGYRDYDASVLERLALVGGAKQLDLSLPEIADLLAAMEGDTCTQMRESLRSTLAERMREVEDRLQALLRLQARLTAASRQVDACPDSRERCRTECMLLRDETCEISRHRSVQG